MTTQSGHNSSVQEEEQYVENFLRILESLGEHASSYLFQKGLIRGDETYKKYEQDLNDNSLKNTIINALVRPDENNSPGEDINLYAAILLQITSREAAQMFFDINALSYEHIGIASGVVTLGYQLALIDRTAAFLGLPSINDKSYWRLITSAQQSVQSKPQTQPPVNLSSPSSDCVIRTAPDQTESAKTNAPPSVTSVSIQKKDIRSTTNTVKRTSSEKKDINTSPSGLTKTENLQKVTTNTPAADLKDFSFKPPGKKASVTKSPEKVTAVKKTKKNRAKDKHISSADDTKSAYSSKRDGPIQAMLRRIVSEIHSDSFDAVINALKDTKFMMGLYKAAENPITVKVLEVDPDQRVVYIVKKKRGQREPVKFTLIRKLLSEM